MLAYMSRDVVGSECIWEGATLMSIVKEKRTDTLHLFVFLNVNVRLNEMVETVCYP